jgi:hypothetical protein
MKSALLFLLISTLTLATQGCGKDDASSLSPSAFLEAAIGETVPKLSAVSSTLALRHFISAQDNTWADGQIGYNIYNLLREAQYGVTDNSNLYMNLKSADQSYVSYGGQATKLDAAKAVASPFNFGTGYDISDLSFDYGANGLTGNSSSSSAASIALRADGDNRYLLIASYPTVSSSDYSKSVMQVSYNSSNGAIKLNQVLYLRYVTGTMAGQIYANRMWIDGNAKTHTFKVKAIQGGKSQTGDFTYKYSLVGNGVSQGTGNYFLINIKNGPSATSTYFCVESGMTGDQFKAFFVDATTGAGATSVNDTSLANCTDYKTYVSGIADGTDATNGGLMTAGDLAQTDTDAHFVGTGTYNMSLSL